MVAPTRLPPGSIDFSQGKVIDPDGNPVEGPQGRSAEVAFPQRQMFESLDLLPAGTPFVDDFQEGGHVAPPVREVVVDARPAEHLNLNSLPGASRPKSIHRDMGKPATHHAFGVFVAALPPEFQRLMRPPKGADALTPAVVLVVPAKNGGRITTLDIANGRVTADKQGVGSPWNRLGAWRGAAQ